MAWSTWVQLCGRFALERDGERVEERLPGRQGRLALAFLAAHEERWVTREELAFAIWGDAQPPDADGSLSSVLSKVRRVAGADRVTGRSSLRFVRDQTTYVDLHYARDALHRAQVHLDDGDPRLAWQPAHTAFAIADRQFLTGLDAPWIEDIRRSLETLCLAALECETRALIGVDEIYVAEHAARRLTERAPFRESGYLLLMNALERAGNRAEALLAFDRLRTLLHDELGTVPGPEVSSAHQRLLREGR